MTSELKLHLIGEIEKLTWEDFDKKETSIETEITSDGKNYWFLATIEEGGELVSASLTEDENEEELLQDNEIKFLAEFTEYQFRTCISEYFDEVEHRNQLLNTYLWK